MTVHFEEAGRKKEVGADLVGSGIWYGEGDEWNATLCTKHDTPSREVGELIAICWVAKNEPQNLCDQQNYPIQKVAKNGHKLNMHSGPTPVPASLQPHRPQ